VNILVNEITLSVDEKRILNSLMKLGGIAFIDDLARISGFSISKLNALSMLLKSKGLVRDERETRIYLRAREELLLYYKVGLPEKNIGKILLEKGETSIEEIEKILAEKFSADKVRIGLMWLKKRGWIRFERRNNRTYIVLTETGREKILSETDEEKFLKIIGLKRIVLFEEIPVNLRPIVNIFLRRKLIEKVERSVVKIIATQLGIDVYKNKYPVVVEITRLTRDHIVKGDWRKYRIKEYDLTARPPIVFPGKKHPYIMFLEEVRRILIGMGFEEARGPLVEAEFWNFDALFQAQDHPAREVHDSYILKYPGQANLDRYCEYVNRVKLTHENGWITGSRGWRYKWSFDLARRLVLRSQTTAVSMRTLYGKRKPPVKMFVIGKVFRPETLDSRHSMEFTQVEGIVLGEGLNLKHLLGYLRQFALELGFKKIRFKPGYFPFTEPSVEAFAYHPKEGWIEILGSGLFRPEVLIPLGIDYPRVQCLAWGIGIGRLAMIKLGIDDIRELHSQDLRWLREKGYG